MNQTIFKGLALAGLIFVAGCGSLSEETHLAGRQAIMEAAKDIVAHSDEYEGEVISVTNYHPCKYAEETPCKGLDSGEPFWLGKGSDPSSISWEEGGFQKQNWALVFTDQELGVIYHDESAKAWSEGHTIKLSEVDAFYRTRVDGVTVGLTDQLLTECNHEDWTHNTHIQFGEKAIFFEDWRNIWIRFEPPLGEELLYFLLEYTDAPGWYRNCDGEPVLIPRDDPKSVEVVERSPRPRTF